MSSGSRTAFAGGARDRWEQELFGRAYQHEGVLPSERPKYGVLELIRYPDGPLPRFGSCYFVLRPTVSQRCTFTFGGSEQPGAIDRFGTIQRFLPVAASLLEEIAAGGRTPVKWPPFIAPTLGVPSTNVCDFLDRLRRELAGGRPDARTSAPGRVLDSGIEAHIHGAVDLQNDVEFLVTDPAFDDTGTSVILSEVCRRYTIPRERHCGFRMPVEDVPADFRGPRMKPLADRIADNGMIDAAVIGAAEASLYSRPQDWEDWGSGEETLQHLKQLWHVLVHYGAPARTYAG